MYTNKITINKMLNGTMMINVMKLKMIADYLGVNVIELTSINREQYDINIVIVS